LKAYIKEERIIRLNEGAISVLNETPLNSTDKSDNNIKENFYLRQILVNTRAKAEDIIDRIAKGEPFKEVALKESKGPNAYAGGYIGRVDPSHLHTSIADALLNNYESDDPVIVETERGFHIIQRITLPDREFIKH
jgi:parvulin-like peptidyl-prolyl isomerase